jgi:hypothetical protein
MKTDRMMKNKDTFSMHLLAEMVNTLREILVKDREELSALMPSVLDRAFKGEL